MVWISRPERQATAIFWRCCASIRFSRESSAAVPSPISFCAAANANPDAVQPPERTEVMTLSRKRSGGTTKPSGKAVEHHATIRRERGQRRLVVEKSVNGVFDDDEIELLDNAQQISAPRGRHRHAQRILDNGLNV